MGYSTINGRQLCEMLRKAAGLKLPIPASNDPVELLVGLADEGALRLPFDVEDVFWVPYRLPVFNDINLPLHRSQLLSALSARSGDTGLVVDSLRLSSDALFFAVLVPNNRLDLVTEWCSRTRPEQVYLTLKSVDEFYLILATVKSFVVTLGEG